MARIVPHEIDAAARRGHARREIETLERLERELSDEFTVFHGVHWARSDARAALYGEIDFVVMNRLGRLIAIEQKNGPIEQTRGALVKHYATQTRTVRAQVTRNLHHLMEAFARRHPDRRLDVDHLVYLPDHTLNGPVPSAIDPSRIVDATARDGLAARIVALFDERAAPATTRDTGGAPPPDPVDVHDFLCDFVDVAVSVDATSRLAREAYPRVSGGLATWARRLTLSPHRLRVIGTAGSGKTQLALEELRAAKDAGRTALYLCFNRTLADAMRRVAPAPDACMTFHELGAWLLRAGGETIDYTQPGAFDRLADAVVQAAPQMRASVDLLIVDEGQDFTPVWADAVLQLVCDDGRALWLEDPSQNLYRRATVALPGWAVLRAPVNHRSPHVVVTLIEMLGLTDEPIEAGSVVHGFDPQLLTYTDDADLVSRTSAAVRALLDAGHAPQDVVVLSWHGRDRSRVIACDELAGVRTRRFTGAYDDDGQPVLTDGTLPLDTLFRFKGQAADCVVITEIDFDDWSDDVRRRLFVGLTRARLKVALVADATATARIEARLR